MNFKDLDTAVFDKKWARIKNEDDISDFEAIWAVKGNVRCFRRWLFDAEAYFYP